MDTLKYPDQLYLFFPKSNLGIQKNSVLSACGAQASGAHHLSAEWGPAKGVPQSEPLKADAGHTSQGRKEAEGKIN
jgi:hypothetical protein